jgi:hypothetical protein
MPHKTSLKRPFVKSLLREMMRFSSDLLASILSTAALAVDKFPTTQQ